MLCGYVSADRQCGDGGFTTTGKLDQDMIQHHNDMAVVLPFDIFLKFADVGMGYADIVARAIEYRKSQIIKYHHLGIPV